MGSGGEAGTENALQGLGLKVAETRDQLPCVHASSMKRDENGTRELNPLGVALAAC